MSAELAELFARYKEFFDHLEADDPALKSRRIWTLEGFEEFWARVCEDPRKEESWLRYLEPGGYEQYRAECAQEAEQFLQLLGI